MLVQVNQTFIGVHHLLHMNICIGNKGEWRFGIKIGVDFFNSFQVSFKLGVRGGENSTREIPTIWKKENLLVKSALQTFNRLIDLTHMLMGKRLVIRKVIVSPGVMRCC